MKSLIVLLLIILSFTSISCVSNSKVKEPFPSWQESAADQHLEKLDSLEAGLLQDIREMR